MKLLLDTHTFMWWHSEPEYIPIRTHAKDSDGAK
jgi:PIN domain nuclease of toxin-antitoxin system